jgi:chromosome segregation ATPase
MADMTHDGSGRSEFEDMFRRALDEAYERGRQSAQRTAVVGNNGLQARLVEVTAERDVARNRLQDVRTALGSVNTDDSSLAPLARNMHRALETADKRVAALQTLLEATDKAYANLQRRVTRLVNDVTFGEESL